MQRSCSPLLSACSRRDALGRLAGAAAGTALLGSRAWAGATSGPAPARAMIQIWLWGGPSHLDTFDPKPEAGHDYCGPLDHPIATNVDGIRISELLPLLAKRADRYSLLRSLTHGNNGHETAAYMVQTGRMSGGTLVHPSIGAVVSLKRGYDAGYRGLIPPYVVLTQPLGRFSEAGFLGQRYKPFATGGNPAEQVFAVEGVVSKDIPRERMESRRDLLRRLDRLPAALPGHPELARSQACADEAWELILGSAGKVFDLAKEPAELRERYGTNTFGQACLTARRLVETGVPFVTINFNGWDTHKQHFTAMRTKVPQLDRGLATLLDDLKDHGLLDQTIVWCGGEFGRTPKIQWEAPWNGGRSHFGKVFSGLLAGGGFKGGRVVGASNATGEEVKDRPVHPWDLIGSLYERMGIDPDGTIPHPQGYDVRLLPGPEEKLPSGGRLKELV